MTAPIDLADSYLGIVRPRDVTTVALPAAVVVRRVIASVGDEVTSGQPLIELDDEAARQAADQMGFELTRVSEQREHLERTVARLDRSIHSLTVDLAETTAQLSVAQREAQTIPNRQLKDSPERAQAAFEQAQAHERRLALLASAGLVPRQDAEDAQIAVRLAADDLSVARRLAGAERQAATLQGGHARMQAELAVAEQRRFLADRTGDLVQTRLREAQVQAAADAARARLEDLSVRAPRAGTIAAIGVQAGDRVLAGVPLVKLATLDPMQVDLEVPPGVVNAMRRHDAVRVLIAGTSSEFDGRVLMVEPLPGAGGAHALSVEFRNPARLLLAGWTARVRFSPERR